MVSALIVAAGRGTRMGPDVDKLFLPLAGRPLVAHTWERFDRAGCVEEIVLVIRAGLESAFKEMAVEFGFKKPFRLAIGGAERQDSVWNGLAALGAATEIVAIQDGARPCTGEALIEATIAAAREVGAAVTAQRVVDTIKESSDGALVERTLERRRLWAVQTPQTFRVEVIRRALTAARARNLILTDDTAACELIGQAVRLVEATQPNPKATSPADLAFLEFQLARGAAENPALANHR